MTDTQADDIAKQEAESVADAKRRLAKRSGTATQDGEAVALAISKIQNSAKTARTNGYTQPVTLSFTIPELFALATLTRQLAEAQAERDMHSEARVFAANRAYRAESDLAEAQGVIERLIEQCAQTAEAWHPMLYAPEHGGSHPTDSAYRSAREGIARAIRALSAAMGTDNA